MPSVQVYQPGVLAFLLVPLFLMYRVYVSSSRLYVPVVNVQDPTVYLHLLLLNKYILES